MVKGFKVTLFAGAITLSALAPAFAAAPVVSGLPDVTVGDLEDSTATDNNLFVYSDAFDFNNYVTDSDTADSALLWSFAEFNGGLGTNEYTINGAGPVVNGTTAIGTEEINGNPAAQAPGANQINASSDTASFRNIILSPTSGSIPFADPTPTQAAAAAVGKVIRYYVSDPEGNVGFADALINSVDNGSDSLFTPSDGYQEQLDVTDFSDAGWQTTVGIGDPAISSAKVTGALTVNVQAATATSRYGGWKNDSLLEYNDVGVSKYVHGKFYISASNPVFTSGGAITPINNVPGFRLRLSNEGAVQAATHYEYGQTGLSGPAHEPRYPAFENPAAEQFSIFLRPADNNITPSMYKIDFDPVDVPAAVGSQIGGLFEAFTQADPANGTLTLYEVVLGTYDAKTDGEGNLLFKYDRTLGIANGVGGAKTMTGGAFNAENNFEIGRLRALELPAPLDNDPGPYASNTDQGVNGIFMTTNGVSDDVFGIDLMNIQTDNANRVRISPGKLYRARYYATSSVPATSIDSNVESQGNLVFRFQTVAGTLSYRTELNSTAISAAGFGYGAQGDAISNQAIPSVSSVNPETDVALETVGESGGWYSVIVSSPLDEHAIREDYDTFLFLGSQPGPGDAADSARDVLLGVDLLSGPSTITVEGGNSVNFARPNRAEVRISALEVFEYDSIDDGGYDFDGL